MGNLGFVLVCLTILSCVGKYNIHIVSYCFFVKVCARMRPGIIAMSHAREGRAGGSSICPPHRRFKSTHCFGKIADMSNSTGCRTAAWRDDHDIGGVLQGISEWWGKGNAGLYCGNNLKAVWLPEWKGTGGSSGAGA